MNRVDITSLIPCYDIAYEDELNTQGSWYTMISIIFIDAMVMSKQITELFYCHYFVYRNTYNENHLTLVNKINLMYYNIYALPNTYKFLSRHIALIVFIRDYVGLLSELLNTYHKQNKTDINNVYIKIIDRVNHDFTVYLTL